MLSSRKTCYPLRLTNILGTDLKITAVTMIRNEIDIISDFLAHQLQFFDEILIADMQSSDGTTEIINQFSKKSDQIKRFEYPYSITFQAEIVTSLSKLAFKQGADWVFFLDADEFLHVESRDDLDNKLNAYGPSIIHLPWINLVPTTYGSFSKFDAAQEFHWSGRESGFSKIAISFQYAGANPDYLVSEGSHHIFPHALGSAETFEQGFPLLHVPVRSLERLKYKASNGVDIQERKHNRKTGHNRHYWSHLDALKGSVADTNFLNGIAQDYGSDKLAEPVDPKALGWPSLRINLPERDAGSNKAIPISARDLRQLDAERSWKPINQPQNAKVTAAVNGAQIEIRPQVIRGTDMFGPQYFEKLPNESPPNGRGFDQNAAASALKASLIPPPTEVQSAWTDLVPCLGALFSLAKPRRFVELGTHNGMSFLSACQISVELNLKTECIAIDSWEGDLHAGSHAPRVFADFKEKIKSLFPWQMYIQTYFDSAASVFDEGSIDLIHIDGFHSYDAVMKDFKTWLPKMSNRAVMIFHDTNVHERGFGVWRFWEEISQRYPHFEVYHGHGLGILYVGDENTDVAEAFSFIDENLEFKKNAITFLERQIEVEKIKEERRRKTSIQERTQLAKRARHLEQQVAKQTQLAKRCGNLELQLAKQTKIAKRCGPLEQQLKKQTQLAKRCGQLEKNLKARNEELSTIKKNKWWMRLQRVSQMKQTLLGGPSQTKKK